MVDTSPGQPAGFLLPSTGAIDDALEQRTAEAMTGADVFDGLDEAGAAEAAAAEASLQRRMADGALVDDLARLGFTGPLQEQFETELARYARSVLAAWLRTGHIDVLLRTRGLGGGLTDAERARARSHRDRHLLSDLADITVAQAIHRFRTQALVEGRWRPDGGATLTTYFMGRCVYTFASELDRYRTEYRHQMLDGFEDGERFERTGSTVAEDPELIAAMGSETRAVFDRLSDRERQVVALTAEGYDQVEIAELLGLSSDRAVEGTLRRMRQRLGPTIEQALAATAPRAPAPSAPRGQTRTTRKEAR